jgi:hypothetical protein
MTAIAVCVNAGIRPAAAGNIQAFAEHRLNRVLQSLLNGIAACLCLPPVKIAPVKSDCQ